MLDVDTTIEPPYGEQEGAKLGYNPHKVVVCCQWTPETTGLFDRRRFAAMKLGSVLVNVARGEIIDEDALAEALEQDRLRGVVLDVYKGEFQHAPSARLWQHPRVLIISGHTDVKPARRDRDLLRQPAPISTAANCATSSIGGGAIDGGIGITRCRLISQAFAEGFVGTGLCGIGFKPSPRRIAAGSQRSSIIAAAVIPVFHAIQNRRLCRILALTTSTQSLDGHSPPFCNSLETIRTSASRSVTSKSNSSPNSAAVALSCCIRVEKSAAS